MVGDDMEKQYMKSSFLRQYAPRKATSRLFLVAIFLSILILGRRGKVLILTYGHDRTRSLETGYPPSIKANVSSNASWNRESSWAKLAHALQVAKPQGGVSASWTKGRSIDAVSLESGQEELVVDKLKMSPASIRIAQESHKKFIDHIKREHMTIPFKPDTRGIVITTTRKRFPEVLASIRLMRRTGSTIPIEIVLPSEKDMEAIFCSRMLYNLRASCRSLQAALEDVPMPSGLNSRRSRQIRSGETFYKLMAIFTSDYEDVLLLDSSTLILNNPNNLFREEPFLSKGLVMWPDFWMATPSKLLLQIQEGTESTADAQGSVNILNKPGHNRNVKLSQLLISKRKHKITLLLAIYYALYGPGLYDNAIQQSPVGNRGDSSILVAANYLKRRYHMITRLAEAAGFPDEDQTNKPFQMTAMVFHSPSDDFHRRRSDWQLPYFISLMGIKADARDIQKAGKSCFKPTLSGEARPHRLWEWFGSRDLPNGWKSSDPEKALWEELIKIACHDAANFDGYIKSHTAGTCNQFQHNYNMLWPASHPDAIHGESTTSS